MDRTPAHRRRGARARRRRVLLVVAACCAVLLVPVLTRAPSADPGRGWTVASPGGVLSATVAARSGSYELTVTRAGRPVLAATLGHPGSPASPPAQDIVRNAYTTPTGKRRSHQLVARRLQIAFARGRRLELLVSDDGVAFRQTGAGNEDGAWRAPPGARAWLQTYR